MSIASSGSGAISRTSSPSVLSIKGALSVSAGLTMNSAGGRTSEVELVAGGTKAVELAEVDWLEVGRVCEVEHVDFVLDRHDIGRTCKTEHVESELV